MKNWKIRNKLSIVLTLILAIGLSALYGMVKYSQENVLSKTLIERMHESVQLRSKIIEDSIASAESYLIGYVQSKEVQTALQNPNDSNIQALQNYTAQYATVNTKLENIYLADLQSVVKASMVTAPIGKQLREGDSLSTLIDHIFKDSGVYNAGVLISPSTQSLVLSMYTPIYDASHNPLGYAGMALKTNELLACLQELNFDGLRGCSYSLVDTTSGLYISSTDSTLDGTMVEDQNLLSIIDHVKSSSQDVTKSIEYKDKQSKQLQTAVYHYIADRGWIFLIQVPQTSLYAGANASILNLSVMCLIVLLITVLSVFLAIKRMLKGIGTAVDAITKVSNLNLAEQEELKKYHGRRDEVGILAEAADRLILELRTTIRALKGNSMQLSGQSQELNALFTNTQDAMEQIERAVQDVAAGSGSLAEETQSAFEHVHAIGTMLEELSKETHLLYSNSTSMHTITDDVVATLNTLKAVNETTASSVDHVYQQTYITNEAVSKIQNAVSIISSIADETSLLSLNASIEAARAGEQGRGFGVVATQIQKLAEQSNSSASTINEITQSLMDDSQLTVQAMEDVLDHVKKQSNQVDDTLKNFSHLKTEIDASIVGITHISEQTKLLDEARVNVVDVVSNLSAIAEQNAASTQQTSASVSVMNGDMEKISEMSLTLANMADSTNSTVEKFEL